MIRLFIASPSDVATERNHVAEVALAINRNILEERNVQFRVVGYKTDVRPRVGNEGPQAIINKDLPVEECDIVVGIFWKRFGTPIPEMGGETGTEHEIRTAIAAAKRQSGKPEVVICFNGAPSEYTDDEWEQASQVRKFRKEIGGIEISYRGEVEFRDKIRDYLEKSGSRLTPCILRPQNHLHQSRLSPIQPIEPRPPFS